MILSSRDRGFKLVEVMFTVALVSVVGLLIYSILNTSTVLGAKNTAVNTAHQQARISTLQMMQGIHSAISQPQLTGVSGNQASGISFQQWGTVAIAGKGRVSNGGPHKILFNADVGNDTIMIKVTAGPGITANQSRPTVGQHVIIPTHQIEADIKAVSGIATLYIMTLENIYGPNLLPEEAAAAGLSYPVTYPVATLPVAIAGTGSTVGDVVCYVSERCSYTVPGPTDPVPGDGKTLTWTIGSAISRTMANGIANSKGVLYDSTKPMVDPNVPPKPFSIDTTEAGTTYYRFDLSTSDSKSSNRGYRSTSILLNGQVPTKARLTTYQ